MGFRVSGFGFRVWGSGFGVQEGVVGDGGGLRRCREVGAALCLDLTQSLGVMPFDGEASAPHSARQIPNRCRVEGLRFSV